MANEGWNMYEVATPVAGGVAAASALAYTGAETIALGLIAGTAVIGGLLVLRLQIIRRKRREQH
jgi:hypothetical protein